MKPIRRFSKAYKYREIIETFLKQEDNNRILPGKNDTKSIKKGERVQTYVLVDVLDNLYRKFMTENTDLKISLSTFCRCRPVYILRASFTSRLSCLCTKHQNAAVTMKAIRKGGVEVHTNPERVIKNKLDIEKLQSDLESQIPLSQWTRVETEEKGTKKHAT